MANNNNRPVYGIGQPLRNLFPSPIISTRAPLTTDRLYPLGQVWTNKSANTAYLLTSVVANIATWQEITNAGGGGAIAGTSLTITPGATVLNGSVNMAPAAVGSTITLGNAAMTGTLTLGQSTTGQTINMGTGAAGVNNINIGGTGANVIAIGNTQVGGSITAADAMVAGTLTLGGATMTGAMILGRSAAGQAVNISGAVNTGAQSVSIASGANGAATTTNISNGASTVGANTVNVLSGILAGGSNGVLNLANGAAAVNLDVNILSGVGTGGVATLNMGNNTRVTTIGLGDIAPAAPRTIRIAGGNSAQNDTVAILNGNPSANAQTVSILSGTPNGGTQVLNLGAQTTNPIAINMGSGTGLATVRIANGAAANVVTVGSTNTTAKTTINSGTLSMDLTMAAPVAGAGGILVTQGAVPFRILCGAGAPNNNLAINVGDLYINSTGSGIADRMYICSVAGAWVNFTTSA